MSPSTHIRHLSVVLTLVLLFSANLNLTQAANAELSKASGPAEKFKIFRWNLHDHALPLISLPDYLGQNVDLAISYSLDQFQFPLFQTLYYSQQSGKYMLMVVGKENARVEVLVLDETIAGEQAHARRVSSLTLFDQGEIKVLVASDGTTYTFAHLGDGEFHCSRINDRDGVVINLEYTSDFSIQSIADNADRKINFHYTDRYLSSVTQTWRMAQSRLKQTWAIAERSMRTDELPGRPMLASMELLKRMPTNAVTQGYTDAMAASDAQLASIFGGSNAIAAANGFEPARLRSRYPIYRGDLVADNGKILRGHLSFAMHLYGSDDGTGDTDLYVPAGFASHSNTPTPTDAAVTFYYPRLGNFDDVTLAVFHVADFQITQEGTRVRIGKIGGRGGSIGDYKHSHIEFYRGRTGLPSVAARGRLRIDPATVFSESSNVASR